MAKRKYTSTLEHRTKLYSIWCAMRQRCNNRKNKDFKWYGGKGITICQEWEDFENFKKWAYENGYVEGLSIDRINGNMNYCPNNCRWITLSEQQRNRSNLHYLTYKGETHCMTEWAEIIGMKRCTIKDRLRRGWTTEQALTTPYGSGINGNRIDVFCDSHSEALNKGVFTAEVEI